MHETAIQWTRPPRGIVLGSPSASLPPLPPPRVAPLQAPTAPAVDPLAQREREVLAQVLARLGEAAARLTAGYERMRAEMQTAAVELAVAVAGRLLHDRIAAGEYPVETLVREAVARLPAGRSATVRLHPEDLALLRQRLGDTPLLRNRAELHFQADAALARGGCEAEGGDVQVLAALEAQLAGLRRHLLEAVANAGPGADVP